MLKKMIDDFVYRRGHFTKEWAILSGMPEKKMNRLSEQLAREVTQKKRQNWRRDREIPADFYKYLGELNILPTDAMPKTTDERTVKNLMSSISHEAGENGLALSFLSMLLDYPIENAIAAQMANTLPDEYGKTRRKPIKQIFCRMVEGMDPR